MNKLYKQNKYYNNNSKKIRIYSNMNIAEINAATLREF